MREKRKGRQEKKIGEKERKRKRGEKRNEEKERQVRKTGNKDK